MESVLRRPLPQRRLLRRGERKRNEILQMPRSSNPSCRHSRRDRLGSRHRRSASTVADGVQQPLGSPDRGFLIITHYQRMLEYITPDVVHIFIDGRHRRQRRGRPGPRRCDRARPATTRYKLRSVRTGVTDLSPPSPPDFPILQREVNGQTARLPRFGGYHAEARGKCSTPWMTYYRRDRTPTFTAAPTPWPSEATDALRGCPGQGGIGSSVPGQRQRRWCSPGAATTGHELPSRTDGASTAF